MDNQDHTRTHTQGHETHHHHVCHKCGWPFPNPHPSSKHRRAHKKICGTIQGYKLLISETQNHSNGSDDEPLSDDDDDRNTQGFGRIEKGSDGTGGSLIRSSDEVFLDAIANFSDGGGLSPGTKEPLDSTTDVVIINTKNAEISGSSEDISEAAPSGFLGNKIYAGKNVRNCCLSSEGHDEIDIDSDEDMVEIVVASDNTSVETCKGVPQLAASDLVNLKDKNCAEFISVIPQDELPLEVNSTVSVNTNTSTNSIQVESAQMIQFATSGDVKMLLERGEGNVNMFTRPSCDDGSEMSHPQNEYGDVKDHEAELLQNSLSLRSSEALKQKRDDLKDSVSEESQSSEKGEILSSAVHVLDGSMKGKNNCKLWEEEMRAEKSIEEQEPDAETRASMSAMKTEMNDSYMIHYREEQESDAARRNLQQINLPNGSFIAVSKEKNPSGASFVGSTNETTSPISTDNVSHHEKNMKNMNEVAVDGKCTEAKVENDNGIISIKTLQCSKLLLEANSTSGGIYWSDEAFEMGKIEKCDITDGQCMERPLVKDIKDDEISSGGRGTIECERYVGSSVDDSCQAQDEELLLNATEHLDQTVASTQSDIVKAVIGAKDLPSTEVGRSNSEAALEGHHCENPEMFEPPSFMTLVEPGHRIGPEAPASEVQQLPSCTSLQAGWFPTVTTITNESQGRKRNEETIAKITNESTSKLQKPFKSLWSEASHDKKPKSPKLEETSVNQNKSEVRGNNGSGSGLKSPATQAVEEGVKEWNSPGRNPGIKTQSKKVKSRPYWLQFVCCSSETASQRRG